MNTDKAAATAYAFVTVHYVAHGTTSSPQSVSIVFEGIVQDGVNPAWTFNLTYA
jgi:hypothetical protein